MEQAKKLSDFPEFARINAAVQKLQSEKAEVSAKLDEIAVDLSRPLEQQDGAKSAWDCALEGESAVRYRYAADNRTELREKQIELEGRLRFLNEALEVGEQELDKIRGQASLEICLTVRPAWVAEIKIILESLKKVSDCNERLDAMRREIEGRGIRTGSLAHALFDLGGRWNDEFGGRLPDYQRYISQAYPETTAAAGMEIKVKLAALAKREEEFNQGATE